MNRQTVVDAIDAQGTLGAEGHRLSYDLNGNRAGDTHDGMRIVHWTGQGEVQAGETTEASPPLGRQMPGFDMVASCDH